VFVAVGAMQTENATSHYSAPRRKVMLISGASNQIFIKIYLARATKLPATYSGTMGVGVGMDNVCTSSNCKLALTHSVCGVDRCVRSELRGHRTLINICLK
jgi:hypothetical protein